MKNDIQFCVPLNTLNYDILKLKKVGKCSALNFPRHGSTNKLCFWGHARQYLERRSNFRYIHCIIKSRLICV